jgi:hypothetical protein
VKHAAKLLAEHGFTALPAVDSLDRPIGVVSEADLACGPLRGTGTEGGDGEADRVRGMPIVDGSRVVGVVTRRDLVRPLARDDQAISCDVRHQLAMYGASYRWTVAVHDGAVAIGDQFDNATDRHVAKVLAEAVPGVTAVSVVSASPND